MNPGVIFSLVALVCWGVGDFLTQRATRRFGSWVALFSIATVATIGLLPFVWRDIVVLAQTPYVWLLLGSSVVLLGAALFEFEAFRRGKIAVVEPILAFEVAVTAILAVLVLHEHLTGLQTGLIALVVLGILLVSTRSLAALRAITWEKGVGWAVVGMLAMAFANFLFGYAARETTPLLINWFTSAFIAVSSGMYVFSHTTPIQLRQDIRKNYQLVLGAGIIDNAAWVAFAYSVLFIPISISVAISESYIVLAALLGIFISKEKLKTHQFIGLALTATAAAVLAYVL